jgi:hypothetical protein
VSSITEPRAAHGDRPAAPSRTGTLAGLEPSARDGARGVWLRRLFLVLLAAVVVIGLLGMLGVRSRTVVTTSADGRVELRVHYAHVARAGLGVPFTITVRRAGGFTGDVRLAVSSSYLDLFDRNAIDPEPASSTATGEDLIWVFTRPPGDSLEVSIDVQVQAGRHWGRPGTISVLDDERRPIVSATFKTWLSP